MRLPLRLLLLCLFAVSGAGASVHTAWQARAALGPAVWARVLRIENENPRSPYPATVYATVFEFAGRLWFYTDTDGTQSFSLHRGMLDQEKADFRPLLQDIEPGFRTFEILPDAAPHFAGAPGPVPNGCFIDSVAALQARLRRGEPVTRAALLSYYVEMGTHLHGHTVLAYETPAGLFVLDPAQAPSPVKIRRGSISAEAGLIASSVSPREVVRALWVPVPLGGASAPAFAAAALPASRADGATGALAGLTRP